MLKLSFVSDSFDEEKGEFITDEFVLSLEHSLVSLSKWESEYRKPFLTDSKKTDEEMFYYLKAMIITPEYPDDIFNRLTDAHIKQISEYVDASMTATTIPESNEPGSKSVVITSELVYYWMTSYQIPWEAQYWHLSRLFALIKVFNHHTNAANKKNRPPTSSEMSRRRALNEARRKQLGTTG